MVFLIISIIVYKILCVHFYMVTSQQNCYVLAGGIIIKIQVRRKAYLLLVNTLIILLIWAFFCGVALLRGSRDGGYGQGRQPVCEDGVDGCHVLRGSRDSGHGQGRKPVCEDGAGGYMWSWRRTVVGEGGDSPLGNK